MLVSPYCVLRYLFGARFAILPDRANRVTGKSNGTMVIPDLINGDTTGQRRLGARRAGFGRSHAAAFSLVEVVMALGVMAFGMLSMIGLLPIGMQGFREIKRDTIHANILQYVSANAGLTPFSDLTTLNNVVWSFNEEGEILTSGSGTVIYKATLKVQVPNSTSIAHSANTQVVSVEIGDTDRPLSPARYSILVADLGK
ncbi:MAG: Verru_Chthon cassette protein B [Chthoniobacteraceae bacterium]